MGSMKKIPLSERLARVVALGRDKGRLTYEELNNLLPEDVASPEEIDELLTLLGKEHIEIVDKPASSARLLTRPARNRRLLWGCSDRRTPTPWSGSSARCCSMSPRVLRASSRSGSSWNNSRRAGFGAC